LAIFLIVEKCGSRCSLYAADATLAERADEELAGFGER
jgi:hypothetical protein